RHLRAVFPDEDRLLLLDDATASTLMTLRLRLDGESLALASVADVVPGFALHAYHLAPWEADDRMEYLLARAPSRCGSVLARCGTPGPLASLLLVPETCAAIL